MLYKKNKRAQLDMELFKNPTSEYRGVPFWGWNCKLDKQILIEQIEYFKDMGFGGFHMHSRSGMETEYLSDDFMELVKICVEKARSKGLYAWLYDEDRWPSGAAGGIVTKNKKYCQKYICISDEINNEAVEKEQGIANGLPYLLACYDIVFNDVGELKEYKQIDPDIPSIGEKWYAYIYTSDVEGWINNQAYLDTMSKEAVDEFIRVTHETYKKNVGADFGNLIPAIFTDEPAFRKKDVFPYSKGCRYAKMPWTTDLEKGYEELYGINLTQKLPELFWNLPNQRVSQARYYFHDYVAELFSANFMDNIASWCENNGLSLTGHVWAEQTLSSQSERVGEAMRNYRLMGIPGMDLLCNGIEFSTAKQVQSVVHQYGREAMVSELYGVTNWDFDFRGHKFQGDWQAALGVTVRVPHVSWVTMKGSAKRDYPASFNYQVPWYKEYPYIEDHFARLNTVLTRGKPVVSVGVIHPIESDWLYMGPEDASSDIRRQMENNFDNIINWMMFGLIDFDFVSEALLSDIGSVEDNMLKVGQMKYSTIIVPGCATMRRTTLEHLKKFKENGGRLIFCGEYPKYIEAIESNEGKELYNQSIHVPMSKYKLLEELREERFMEIKTEAGVSHDRLIHSLRKDGDVHWLFIAHGKQDIHSRPFCLKNLDVSIPDKLRIRIKGEFIPTLFDTMSGETKKISCYYENGYTVIPMEIYEHDSLLIGLSKGRQTNNLCEHITSNEPIKTIYFHNAVGYKKEEPNVCILDLAEYRLDDGSFQPMEEVLRIDKKCREILDFPMANGCDVQPWLLTQKDEISHYITLRYVIECDFELQDALLAAEEFEEISLNGEMVICEQLGYYVDKSIKTYKLPKFNAGLNELLVKVPFSKRISVECMYLLGDFSVSVSGTEKKIGKPVDKVHFGNLTNQGFPFFGGNIIYCTEFENEDDCAIEITTGKYRGALVKVILDGEDIGNIVFQPYKLKIPYLKAGKHRLEFVLYGSRINTFNSMHNYGGDEWYGPRYWYPEDEKGFCYEYCIKENGILISPTVKLFEIH